MASINPLSPPSLVGSATSQDRGWNAQNQQQPASGQLLKALVVEAQEGGRFSLDISGNRFTASSTATLSQGQALQLLVVKTEPIIELKIINDYTPAPLAGRSLILLGKSIDLSALLQTVRQLDPSSFPGSLTPASRGVLESFFTSQQNILDNKDGGSALKQLIDNLGLNLEHLLAKGDTNGATQTLKAVLLELMHNFGSNTKSGESAGKLISTLELFQLIQLQAGTDSQYIFPLPLPFVEQGYLLINRDGQGSEASQDPAEKRFSLHLTVSDLGNLRIDFLQNAEGLFIKFAADSKEKADFLATFGDELKASVTVAPLIGLTFSEGAPDPINDLILRLMPEGRSMLDTMV